MIGDRDKHELREVLARAAVVRGNEWRPIAVTPTHHYGRVRAACGAGRATRLVGLNCLTLKKREVTCFLCGVELSGRKLLASFRRDLDGAM